MIHCKELNEQFPDTITMFAALKANKETIVSLKKSAVKNSDPVSLSIHKPVMKAASTALGYGDYIYPVINTTYYLDSHNDLHVDGLWNKSAKEQSGKTYYVINHELEIGKVISYPKEVEIMVKQMPWTDLGLTYEGTTEALIFKAQLTEKTNRDAFLAFQAKEDIQQSVRMQYVTIDLAVNDNSPDFEEEKAIFDKYFPRIANKTVALDRGYFWAVTEAKISKEGSAVLFGSNDATAVLYSIKDTASEPLHSTHAEPSPDKLNIKSLLNCF